MTPSRHPQIRLSKLRPRVIVVAAGVLAAACGEPTQSGQVVINPPPNAITAHLVVSDSTAKSAVITLSLSVPTIVGRIGSVTARITYDTAALVFVGEQSLGDGVLRAFNPSAGVLRVAAASTQGINADNLLAWRFTVRDPSALARMVVRLDELHENGTADLKSKIMNPTGTGRP